MRVPGLYRNFQLMMLWGDPGAPVVCLCGSSGTWYLLPVVATGHWECGGCDPGTELVIVFTSD